MTELGRLTEYPELPLYDCITSHTARRSFATHYHMKTEMPMKYIMRITAHNTEKAFRKYIKANNLEASVEMRKYWD